MLLRSTCVPLQHSKSRTKTVSDNNNKILPKYSLVLPGTKPPRGHGQGTYCTAKRDRKIDCWHQSKRPELSSPGYCLLGRACMFLFLVAGLQLLLKPSGAWVAVCVSRINAQTRGLCVAQSPCTVPVWVSSTNSLQSAHFLLITTQASHPDNNMLR